MGYDDAQAAPVTAPEAPAPAAAEAPPAAQPPVSADARAKAAERARKHRALKRLKAAKTEAQLREVAAEVATPPAAPRWPARERILEAYGETAQLVGQHLAPRLEGTAFALTEAKAQVLCVSLAPMVAQAKDARALEPPEWLPPWAVAVAGLAVVFGPPLVAELRRAFDDAPAPARAPGQLVKPEGGAA